MNIICYSYLWWHQPTPAHHNIDLKLYFTSTCYDINRLPCVRTLILYRSLQALVMILTHSHVSEHWFVIVFYSCLWWWYQPTPMCQGIVFILYSTATLVISTRSHVSEHRFYIRFYSYLWWHQPTPMFQNIDLILYFTATCGDINPLPCVRTLICYCTLQLLVMTSSHSHVSEHWFHIVFYSYL